jgi:hypothetical protein
MKPDLELDLFKTDWIVNKCKDSSTYSQNLYAALCNNRFIKDNEEWTCSWRYAGGLLSEINNRGDYLDYYCSGMRNIESFVPESYVTDEIRSDLLKLGWVIEPYEPRLEPGTYINTW